MGISCDVCQNSGKLARPFLYGCQALHSVLLSCSCTDDFYGIFPTIIYASSLAIILIRLRTVTRVEPPGEESRTSTPPPPKSGCPSLASRVFFRRHKCQPPPEVCPVVLPPPPPPVENTACDWRTTLKEIPRYVFDYSRCLWFNLDPNLNERLLEDIIIFCLYVISLRVWILLVRILQWTTLQISIGLEEITKDLTENTIVSFLRFIKGQQEYIHASLCWCICMVPANYASDQFLSKLYNIYLRSQITIMDLIQANFKSISQLFERAIERLQCNEEPVSAIATSIFIISAIRLVHLLTYSVFRRSLFRRIPLWERLVQDSINVVLVIHCVKAWFVYTGILRWIVDKLIERKGYHYLANIHVHPYQTPESMFHLALCWCTASSILVFTILLTFPRDDGPHILIWIATSPWRHTEIGPTAYYLHRPIQQMPSTSEGTKHEIDKPRLVHSTNDVILTKKNHNENRRRSKSI